MASLLRLVLHRLGRLGQDDRGVVAIIVAILVGGGVLVGMSALVIDVGQIYQERAELQNGADAAAMAVAKSCALGACDTAAAAAAADANASRLTGGTEGISAICGSAGLGDCPPATGKLRDCLSGQPSGTNFVQVDTSTQLPSGSTLLPPSFATTLIGNSGYRGDTVYACAQVEWGAPASATTAALTISACEWDQATQGGTVFGQEPPYPPDQPPSPSIDQQLMLGPGSGGGCSTEGAGADGPNLFGWVNHTPGNCHLLVAGSFASRTRPSTSISCAELIQQAQQEQLPLLLPVYVTLDHGTFSLAGFASFVVTGYNFPDLGLSAPDWLNAANDCPDATTDCLSGYFVRSVIPATGELSGSNLGASVIDLTG